MLGTIVSAVVGALVKIVGYVAAFFAGEARQQAKDESAALADAVERKKIDDAVAGESDAAVRADLGKFVRPPG